MISVNILATCRKPELMPATKLVFDSLRTGFPSSKIILKLNEPFTGDKNAFCNEVESKIGKLHGFTFGTTNHHEWILGIINELNEPTFLLDTDCVFWSNFERFDFSGAALAGRWVPSFFCSFANAITRPRLHGCLLYIDPVKVKAQIEEYGKQFPDCYATPRPTLQDLVFPRYVPHTIGAIVNKYFYDTCSLLYHAIGGQPFTEDQNLSFDHLQSGTLSDIVAPNYPGGNMREWHAAVMDQPHLLKGQWKRDQEFYRSAYAE